jgi:hypothetical protein
MKKQQTTQLQTTPIRQRIIEHVHMPKDRPGNDDLLRISYLMELTSHVAFALSCKEAIDAYDEERLAFAVHSACRILEQVLSE